jgi:hypothetical protein
LQPAGFDKVSIGSISFLMSFLSPPPLACSLPPRRAGISLHDNILNLTHSANLQIHTPILSTRTAESDFSVGRVLAFNLFHFH